MPLKKNKYLSCDAFKKYTFEALSSQFFSINDFEEFFISLNSDDRKNEFLRVGTAYLFFVKNGDWHVNVEGCDPVVSYFTNSFKLVSALSITESLSNTKHMDFFQWLNKKSNRHLFPIENEAVLKQHYSLYKEQFGSIKSVIDFFENLSQKTKDSLCKRVTVNRKSICNIEELIKLIYNARSNFAHSTDPTL